jgi:hypothetical protein
MNWPSDADLSGSRVTQYSDIWVRADGVEWELLLDRSAQELHTAMRSLAKRDMHPVHVYGYARFGASYFIAIFEKQPGLEVAISLDMPPSEMQRDHEIRTKEGWRPKTITGYQKGRDFFATLWGKRPLGAARYGEFADDIDKYLGEQAQPGMRLVFLSAYSSAGGTRYNLIWDR